MKTTSRKYLLISIMLGLSVMTVSAQMPGDVNTSGSVDIVDALLIAQYFVGLNPANFAVSAADTNCSGNVDIVDALLVVQYYIGLVPVLTGCGTVMPTANPTGAPSATPTVVPTILPTVVPTGPAPTVPPTPPGATPTAEPTATPENTPEITPEPTILPAEPTMIGITNSEPDLVWTGERYGLVWSSMADYLSEARGEYAEYTIKFAQYDSQGNRIQGPTNLSQNANWNRKLIWNGSQYGYFFTESVDSVSSSLYYEAIDSAGVLKSRSLLVESKRIEAPSYAWTGAEYIVVWGAFDDAGVFSVYFSRIDASGNRLQADIDLSYDVPYSWYENPDKLIWNGSTLEYFHGPNSEGGEQGIYIATMDRYGNVISDRLLYSFANGTGLYVPDAILQTGNDYATVLRNTSDPSFMTSHSSYFTLLDQAGNIVGGPTLIVPDCINYRYTMSKGGDRYGICWEENYSYMMMCIVDSAGNRTIENEFITDPDGTAEALMPRMAWTGNEFGIAFRADRVTSPIKESDIYLSRIDANGNKIGSDIRLTFLSDNQ